MKRDKAMDFPKSVLIETYNKCNGSCAFCPYHTLRKNEKETFLDEQKVYDLITECSKHPFKRLSLFNNNEPLLDERIYKFIAFSRKVMPDVEITLSSNGKILTEEILQKLAAAGLNSLFVSIPSINKKDYADLMKHDGLERLLNVIKNSKYKEIIRIAVPETYAFNKKEMMDFFGQMNVKVCTWALEHKASWDCFDFKKLRWAGYKHMEYGCDRALDQAVISADGDVVMCCRDWQKEGVLGNVYNNSIKEIWHSDKMKAYQQFVISNNYNNIKLCRDCTENSCTWED